MQTYRLEYADGTIEIVEAASIKELIKKYDLATKKHLNTKIIAL